MTTIQGFLTCLLLATNYFRNTESARRKMSPKCEAAWNECSLLTTDAIENFLMNKICENVKKSMDCYTRHGCPEGEPHLKSLHRACGTIKEPVIRAEKIPPASPVRKQPKKATIKAKKIPAKNQQKPSGKTKKSSGKIKSSANKNKKSSSKKVKSEL